MPSSGKSTIGKLLSKKIGYKFMDTDDLIEEKEQLAICEIFKEKGEAYFRQKEKEVVEALKNVSRTVIATGGGLPAFFDNLLRLKKMGTVVYLRVPLEEIEKRTAVDSNRPLLANDSNAPLLAKNRREKLEEIINFRQCYYEKADLIIDNYLLSKEEICEIIACKTRDL